MQIFVVIVTSQILNGLCSKYSISDSFIQYQKSSFSTTIFLTSMIQIEELKVTETFIQRNLGLASLIIVSRANPAKVTRILKYLINAMNGILLLQKNPEV
ncbi:PH domain-containing protein [Lysinibacillus sphaericus]|uniref:PH domain-containing protein n=1 Tax=Lysinibacillus sphaericus TaxID=1421 RepID=UPI00380D2EBC